jgi:hypothetical protein
LKLNSKTVQSIFNTTMVQKRMGRSAAEHPGWRRRSRVVNLFGPGVSVFQKNFFARRVSKKLDANNTFQREKGLLLLKPQSRGGHKRKNLSGILVRMEQKSCITTSRVFLNEDAWARDCGRICSFVVSVSKKL